MILPARYPPLGERHEQDKHGLGQEQPGLTIKNKQKIPADRESLQEYGNALTTLQVPHDPIKNVMIRLQRLARAARHHPLGEGYEQAGAAIDEHEMGRTQPGTFTAEVESPQILGSAKIKIPTHKRASNQPGDLYAASNMGRNEMATSIIYIRGRHSPPPR